MKKIFTLFAALMMVFSMSAATKTIYCKMAQSWWKADGAAVGAYYWDPSTAPAWPGVRMTPVAGETDLWSIDLDTDKYKKIIFTRVNGSGTVSDWGTKTGDLVIPTDEKNLFTITNTTASWGGGCVGNWSVYAPEAPKSYKDITITVVANATPKIHYWEGGDKMVGSVWETKPDMVATGEENTYSYTIKDVDEATGVKYLVVVGDVQSADQMAFENVTKNFKELLPQVAVMGVNNWDGTDKMTVADDYLSASITLSLEAAKNYELKLTVDGQWYGGKTIAITKENNSASFAENGDGNGKLTTDLAGDYVFTYTYATKTLVVTYPTPPVVKYTVTATAENGTVTGVGEYEEGATVTLEATANEGYEFVNWTKGEEVVSTEATYTFTITENVALVANFQEVAPAIVEMELTMTNLEVQSYGEATGLWASDDDNGVEVMLFLDAEGNLMEEESSIAVGWNDYAVTGTVTKVYNEELATDVYTAELYATIRETNYKLIITMYAVPVEVVDVVVENATITVEEKSDGVGGTYELINVSAQWGESTLLIEGIEKNYEGFVQIKEIFIVDGEEDWYIWMCQDAVVATVDDVLTVTGKFKNNFTRSVYNVTISGTLPVKEEPKTITWELNGGVLPAPAVPTNEELWIAFMPYYQEYYDVVRAEQPIASVAVFLSAGMGDDATIFTSEDSDYKWLGDYIIKVTTEQSAALTTLANWKFNAQAFFNANQYTGWPKSADFTEAGKPENWGPAYQAAHEVVLPTEPVEEDYVLPTPTREGYTFVGWYDNAEGEGEAMTVLPAGWAGTLYAIWQVAGPATALENIAVEGKAIKTIINGQLVIIKNGVQYNAQGAILK